MRTNIFPTSEWAIFWQSQILKELGIGCFANSMRSEKKSRNLKGKILPSELQNWDKPKKQSFFSFENKKESRIPIKYFSGAQAIIYLIKYQLRN